MAAATPVSTPAVGDRVTIRFQNTRLPTATATVVRLGEGVTHVRYQDDIFAGLHPCLVRLPGWARRAKGKRA
jgi:hypothetical protein